MIPKYKQDALRRIMAQDGWDDATISAVLVSLSSHDDRGIPWQDIDLSEEGSDEGFS